MENNDIAIRDPFILKENDRYYLYGTRSDNFGQGTGGFDVYVGDDLVNWSDPVEIFNSERFNMNKGANWAPEVHKFNGKYYLFATFEQKNGYRGTYSLVCDTPDGQFVPCSDGALTPEDWWSLDGTLYVSKNGKPYLVFCHEHVQIRNGTVCYVELNDTLSAAVDAPVYLFSGSDANGAVYNDKDSYVTDGPFLFRGKNDRLYMIWSTGLNGQYYQCLAYSDNGEIDGNWIQADPLFTKDGGHGMIFTDFAGKLKLTLHCPNVQPLERPVFFDVSDDGNSIIINK